MRIPLGTSIRPFSDKPVCQKLESTISNLQCRSPRKQRAVDGIDHRLRADLPTAEESAVETLDRILAALDTVELEVYVALGIGI